MREKAAVKTPVRSKAANESDRDDDSDVSGNFNLAFDVDTAHTSSRSTPTVTSRYMPSTVSKRASPTLDFGAPEMGVMAVQLRGM